MERPNMNLLNAAASVLLFAAVFMFLYQINLNSVYKEYLIEKQNDEMTVSWYEPDNLTVNTRDTPQPEEKNGEQAGGETYVINKSSKKFHKESCRYASAIDENNRQVIVAKNARELKEQGFLACSSCGN